MPKGELFKLKGRGNELLVPPIEYSGASNSKPADKGKSTLSSKLKSLSLGSSSNPQFKLNEKGRIIELPDLDLVRETLDMFSRMHEISEELSHKILSKSSDTYLGKNQKFHTMQMPLEHRLAYGQIEYKHSHLYYDQENSFSVDHKRFDNAVKHLYRAASALNPRAIREILYLLPCDYDNYEYIHSHFTALNSLTDKRDFHSSWSLPSALNYTEQSLMQYLNNIISVNGILKAYQNYLANPGNVIYANHIEDCIDVLIQKYESWNPENINDFIRPHQNGTYNLDTGRRYTHRENIYPGSQSDMHEQLIETYKKLIENHDTHFSNKLIECLEPNRNFMLHFAHIMQYSYIPQEHVETIWNKCYPLIKSSSFTSFQDSGLMRVIQLIPKTDNMKFALKALFKDSTLDPAIREFLQTIV